VTQLSLSWQSVAVQPRELKRVKSEVAPLILAFWKEKGNGAQFHMAELTKFVAARTTIAPDSAGRILRDMRQGGEINYRVVSRRESLYRIEETKEGA
jgi:hypothetical protein